MNTVKPIRKPGILFKDIGNERLLYSVEGKEIHALNPTAKLIWELCDGGHSCEDMEQAIRAKFAVHDKHDVIGDIKKTLEVLGRKGLLETF
jgi:hypothetical protein